MAKRGISEVSGAELNVSSGSDPSSAERELHVTMALGDRNTLPKMPWEASPFAMDVLGPTRVPWLAPPAVPRSLVTYPAVEQVTEVPTLERKDRIRNAVHERVRSHPDATRARVLLKWSELFMVHPDKTWPGRLLLDCYDDEAKIMRTLEDLFRRKPSSTLQVRVGSLSSYFAWVCSEYPAVGPFPVKEEHVYEYACMC